jgi:hypothetical protein
MPDPKLAPHVEDAQRAIASLKEQIAFWSAQPDLGVRGFDKGEYCSHLHKALAEWEAALAILEGRTNA